MHLDILALPVLLLIVSSSLATLQDASAQASMNLTSKEVSGKYLNEKTGVEIKFPDGWTGSEMSMGNTIVVTLYPKDSQVSTDVPHAALFFSIVEKSKAEMPITAEPPVKYEGYVDCVPGSSVNLNVAGVIGLLSGSECTVNGVDFELESILVNTESRWIVLTMFGEEEAYEEFISAAGLATMDTLKTSDAIDVEGAEDVAPPLTIQEIEIRSNFQQVMVAGEFIEVRTNSSSSITDFKLDEDNGILWFKTQGEAGTEGLTEISIGKILEGTYVVTVDDKIIDQWTVDETATGETILTIVHTNGAHDISISGTHVVPEFSFLYVIIIFSVAVSSSMFLRRFKYLKSFNT